MDWLARHRWPRVRVLPLSGWTPVRRVPTGCCSTDLVLCLSSLVLRCHAPGGQASSCPCCVSSPSSLDVSRDLQAFGRPGKSRAKRRTLPVGGSATPRSASLNEQAVSWLEPRPSMAARRSLPQRQRARQLRREARTICEIAVGSFWSLRTVRASRAVRGDVKGGIWCGHFGLGGGPRLSSDHFKRAGVAVSSAGPSRGHSSLATST